MRKILVVEPEQLLGAAILYLLSHADDLYVVSLTPSTSAKLIAKINQLQPDVVIIDQASHFVAAAQLLPAQYRANFCLMTLSTETNWVNIGRQLSVEITKGADLTNILHHCQKPLSSKPTKSRSRAKTQRTANHRNGALEPRT